MLKPWNGHAPSEIPAISFGTWEQCLQKEGWAHFTVLAKRPIQKPVTTAAKDALRYAVELQSDPTRYEVEGYRIGPGAYENWIAAVERGMGSSHGHWWNGMVWAECRQQAAVFFRELAEHVESQEATRACAELSSLYDGIGTALSTAKEKDVAQSEQLRLLCQARDAERSAPNVLEGLAAAL